MKLSHENPDDADPDEPITPEHHQLSSAAACAFIAAALYRSVDVISV